MPNVCTIGYVRIDYCRRPIADVQKDIAKYAGWSVDYPSSGLAVHGIFFDETPNLHSDKAATYLDSISDYVKAQEGILGERLVSLDQWLRHLSSRREDSRLLIQPL